MSDVIPIDPTDDPNYGMNSDVGMYPGRVPLADEWNAWFAGKVDTDSGYLINPTVIGDLTLSDGSTAASVAYVNSMTDASGAGIPDAPADGVYYARINNSWAQAPITIPSNNVTGDMMVTGNFTVTGFATFGPLTVNGSGKFILSPNTSWLTITSNVATAPPPLLPNDTQLQFVGGDGLCSRTEYVTYGDMGILTFRKANGIGAAPTATNGNMFALIGQGHDGSAWTTSQRSGSLPPSGCGCNQAATCRSAARLTLATSWM
jgi:hypothetical protein